MEILNDGWSGRLFAIELEGRALLRPVSEGSGKTTRGESKRFPPADKPQTCNGNASGKVRDGMEKFGILKAIYEGVNVVVFRGGSALLSMGERHAWGDKTSLVRPIISRECSSTATMIHLGKLKVQLRRRRF